VVCVCVGVSMYVHVHVQIYIHSVPTDVVQRSQEEQRNRMPTMQVGITATRGTFLTIWLLAKGARLVSKCVRAFASSLDPQNSHSSLFVIKRPLLAHRPKPVAPTSLTPS